MLHLAQALQLTHYDSLKNQVSAVDTAISLVDPKKDQELFIEHNLRPFDCPADWTFEPCASHYDTVSKTGPLVWPIGVHDHDANVRRQSLISKVAPRPFYRTSFRDAVEKYSS